MKDLLEYIVKNLVTKPEEVEINEEIIDLTAHYTVKVSPPDAGLVIGKSGQTIRAIRKILICRALAENQGLRVVLNLKDNQTNL